MEPAEFARAYGNVPDRSGSRAGLVARRWASCTDPGSQISGQVAIGFAVAPDESPWAGRWSVAVGGRRADGLGHGELTEPPHEGTAGLVARVCELAEAHDPCVLVMNPAGAAGAFEKELLECGFAVAGPGKDPPAGKRRLQVVGAREYAQACGALAADVADDRWRHLGQDPLDRAVAGSRTRGLADAWAWSWHGAAADSTPLEAVTLARHGFMTHGVAGDYDVRDSVGFDVAELVRLYRMGVYGAGDVERCWARGLIDDAGVSALAAAGIPVPAGAR
jgi:hypothetical protein